MSAYEQRVEPPDRQWQYLLFAAEPYETIAFKVIHYSALPQKAAIALTTHPDEWAEPSHK